MLVAPRIVNDVSYVTRIKDETLFTWQAQYLVTLEGDACCSAHCSLILLRWLDTWGSDQGGFAVKIFLFFF